MRYSILAVEDSPTQAAELSSLLTEEYEVTIARSGEEALEVLSGMKFDLVVTDVVMPGISGYDLCRHIKSEAADRALPVVLLTSLQDPMDIVRGLEAGADNYVTKPYEGEHLLNRIRQVLTNQRVRGRARTSMGVSITFLGNEFTITSDKEQILDLLLSSVEDVIRTNDALQQATQEADRANRAKSEFLSRMSHELRTPLNAILGFGELLDHGGLEPDDSESVKEIRNAGRYLLKLVDEVLDIAKVEGGHMDLTMEAVSLAELSDEVLRMMAPVAAARRISLDSEIEAVREFVWSDKQRLKQVILNLLSNGVKYNRDGGTVAISCESLEEGWVRLLIADSGPGIAPADLHRLFSPFSRLPEHSGSTEGTGLGLALSRRLVEAMGGEMGVSSVLGEGSTFWCDLPVADVPDPERKPARAESAANTGSAARTVLYLDENPGHQRLVGRVLSALPDVEVVPALQGRLGLEIALRTPPDLILLSLDLPDLPGEDVLRQIRSEKETENVPVIVISNGETGSAAVERLLEEGADACLKKPLDLTKLARLVTETLKDEGPSSGTHD